MKTKLKSILAVALCAVGLAAFAEAASVSLDQASYAVRAWVSRGRTLSARFGSSVEQAVTHTTSNGAKFHAFNMKDGGTVLMSADTEIEPVIAFTSESTDISSIDPKSPLWAILDRDLSARGNKKPLLAAAAAADAAVSREAKLWDELIKEGQDNAVRPLFASAMTSFPESGDLRVAPLVKSKWGQTTSNDRACWNYYTPSGPDGSTGNAACGCVATAMAQVMRYHKFPNDTVAQVTHTCTTNGNPISLTTQAGTYDWEKMTLDPNSSSGSMSDENYQAIGKLTSDAGITVFMQYADGESTAFDFDITYALMHHWGYQNSVFFDMSGITPQESGADRDQAFQKALFANLDAGYPVCMGVSGHTVVADGYGYSEGADYVHLNMGWAGQSDYWYNLPDVTKANPAFTAVDDITYNIFPDKNKQYGIISGRLIDAETGKPCVDAEVTLKAKSGSTEVKTRTTATGVYGAVVKAGTYVISAVSSDGSKSGMLSSAVTVKAPSTSLVNWNGLGRLTPSVSNVANLGNSWGNEIVLMAPPLGSETNPWEIGANAAADVIAFSNGTGTVFFDPAHGTVTKAGLETITNAMGGADFPAKLIAADGSETNDLVMVLGASGTAYGTIADALAANETSYTLGCIDEKVRPKFGPDENGEFFRYEVVDDVTNIVFSVTNTYAGLYYSVDYKLNESDDWMDGELTPGSNGVTYVSAPYLGATALYSPRVTDDPTVYPPLTYAKNADGTCTVTGVRDGATVSGILKIPAVRRGLSVKALGAGAFKDQTAVTGIQLPLTFGEIPAEAFSGCTGLKFVEIPESVSSLGEQAFNGSGLKAVYFDGNAPTASVPANLFPADTVLYVRSGATGFGDVPGTWNGYQTVVWPETLQPGYVLYGQIRATGDKNNKAYIDTGYLHTSQTKIECRVSMAPKDKQDNYLSIFGGGNCNSMSIQKTFGFDFKSKSIPQFWIGDSRYVGSANSFPLELEDGCFRTVDLSCSADGAEWGVTNKIDKRSATLVPADENQQMLLFAKNDGNGQVASYSYGKFSLGWFKIYEGDALVRDFRPALDLRTDTPGVYDLAAGGDAARTRFAAGIGDFAVSADPLPEPGEPEPDEDFTANYKPLDHIGVSGTQYLDLGYAPTAGATVRAVGGIAGYMPSDWTKYGQGLGTEANPTNITELRIYENGAIVRRYIPCECTAVGENRYVKGLYELSSKTFCTNVGTGYLIPRLPTGYQEVEYISSTRYGEQYDEQYIDTGFVPTVNSKFKIDCNILSASSVIDEWSVVFGEGTNASGTDDCFLCCVTLGDGKVWSNVMGGYSGDATSGNRLPEAERFTASVARSGTTVTLADGTVRNPHVTQDYGQGTTDLSIYLFSTHVKEYKEVGDRYVDKPKDFIHMQVYGFEMYEGDELKRNFVPCYDKDDGRLGLWDLVEKKFYTNKNPNSPDFDKGGNVTNR